MSQFATPESTPAYRHAPWCTRKTVIEHGDSGPEAHCSGPDGDCGQDTDEAVSVALDGKGRAVVMLFPEVLPSGGDVLSTQDALAYGLAIVKAALMLGAKVA